MKKLRAWLKSKWMDFMCPPMPKEQIGQNLHYYMPPTTKD